MMPASTINTGSGTFLSFNCSASTANAIPTVTLQTRQFTPKDGSQRTVYEVVARSVHQISKIKAAKEAPADNDPQVQPSSVEPAIPVEVEANVEVWPS